MAKNWKYIAFFAVSFVILILAETNAPKNIIWEPTFSKYDKNPYGGYIVFEMLKDLFPNQNIRTINQTVYETFEFDKKRGLVYIFINKSFAPDDYDTELLLDFVEKGGAVFIASESFDGDLAETFELEMAYDFNILNSSDSTSLNFVNPNLKAQKDYQYKQGSVGSYFSKYSRDRSVVLSTNQEKSPTLIKSSYGDGFFLFCSTPQAFTNYNMVSRNNAEYIAKSFSYLPVKSVYWDEYFKAGRKQTQTPLRFFLSRKPLKWVLYLTIGTIIVFVFFEAKRKQRIVPVADPFSNTTIEFTETIGRLYFQYKDNKNIAEKQIAFLFEYIRNKLFIPIHEPNFSFVEKIAVKAGVPKEDVEELFKTIQYIQSRSQILDVALINLNKRIENFKEKSGL